MKIEDPAMKPKYQPEKFMKIFYKAYTHLYSGFPITGILVYY